MKKIVLYVFIVFSLYAEKNEIFPMHVESGSVKQMAFNGGGAALSSASNGVSLNPAALFVQHKLERSRGGVSGSYINNKQGRILSGGAGSFAVTPTGVVAADYLFRDVREGEAQNYHRGTLAYSALIQEDNDGSVLTYGVSASYLHNSGDYPARELLPAYFGADSVAHHNSGVEYVAGENHMITTDVGFLEYDALKGISYAVVLENIFGYSWSERKNSVELTRIDSVDINDSVRVAVDSAAYTGKSIKDNGILNGQNKSLLIAFAVQRKVAGGHVLLSVPFDVRFWGLFDKDLRHHSAWKYRCMMRTGAEANVNGKLALRVGYSWAPREYYTAHNGRPQFRNYHQISGGFGLTIKAVTLEMAFKKGEIAAGGAVAF